MRGKNFRFFARRHATRTAAWFFCGLLLAAQPAPERDPAGSGRTQERERRMISTVWGFDHGYQQGFEAGQKDGLARTRFDSQASQPGEDFGFQERFGFREAYRQGFRKGFEQGYGDGFYRRENLFLLRYWDLGFVGQEAADRREALPVPQREAPLPRPESRPEPKPVLKPRPAATSGELLPVPSDTVMRLLLVDTLSTNYNHPGDPFSARVDEPVAVANKVVIPKGSTVKGRLVTIDKAGKVSGRAEMNLRFEQLLLPNGRTVDIVATLTGLPNRGKETVKSEEGTIQGEGSRKQDVATIGTAGGAGAGIGAIAGGARGTAIGAAVGGIAGLAGVLFSRGKELTVPAGTEMAIRLDKPLDLPVYQPL